MMSQQFVFNKQLTIQQCALFYGKCNNQPQTIGKVI